MKNINNELSNQGVLYVVGTPIGNFSDISERVCEALSNADLIAAEDTRKTGILLKHINIHKRLISFHEHNKTSKTESIIDGLKTGMNVALVSDAGMPCISDPGFELVSLCHINGIKVVVIPGPSAVVTAVSGSGILGARFCFEGFLPVKGKERKTRLLFISKADLTVVLYEAPHRLLKTLADLSGSGMGNRRICVARELTKKYEEFLPFTVDEAIAYYQVTEPRGEFVLVIEGFPVVSHSIATVDKPDAKLRAARMLTEGVTNKDIITFLIKEFGYSRNKAYALVEELKSLEQT